MDIEMGVKVIYWH